MLWLPRLSTTSLFVPDFEGGLRWKKGGKKKKVVTMMSYKYIFFFLKKKEKKEKRRFEKLKLYKDYITAKIPER